MPDLWQEGQEKVGDCSHGGSNKSGHAEQPSGKRASSQSIPACYWLGARVEIILGPHDGSGSSWS